MPRTPVSPETLARLLITCPDRPGIIAAVAGFFHKHGGNITSLEEHSTDPVDGTFFLRLEFQTDDLDLDRVALDAAFQTAVADRFEMDWKLHYVADQARTAILVSRDDHAMIELLWRWQRRTLPTEITMVISNHPKLRAVVESFGVPYHHIPMTDDRKPEAEAALVVALDGKADLIVLARYMQILSPGFVSRYHGRIINIHHSFLPAFVGANPYRQAAERGVKIIGATAHYVTADLDAGPIIDQDVSRVVHRYRVSDLREEGRRIERDVLARAVRWHLEDRVIVHQNTTVVFR